MDIVSKGGERLPEFRLALVGDAVSGDFVFGFFQFGFASGEEGVGQFGFLCPTITGGRLARGREGAGFDLPIGIGAVGIDIHIGLDEKRASFGFGMLEFDEGIAVVEVVSGGEFVEVLEVVSDGIDFESVEGIEDGRDLGGF